DNLYLNNLGAECGQRVNFLLDPGEAPIRQKRGSEIAAGAERGARVARGITWVSHFEATHLLLKLCQIARQSLAMFGFRSRSVRTHLWRGRAGCSLRRVDLKQCRGCYDHSLRQHTK